MESTQNIKQRFGIIGNHPGLNRALEKTLRVASTEITVLVSGESGVGKENIFLSSDVLGLSLIHI